MDKIRPINGWGEGRPQHECDFCDGDTQGRTLHLVQAPGGSFYVCDWCYAEHVGA